MIKAQKTERDGTKHGAVKEFSDAKWELMVETFGEKLRWAIISEIPDKKVVEFPEFEDEHVREVQGKPIFAEEFDNMTKKMIISEYNLPEEDKKLTRKELINKVLNKE